MSRIILATVVAASRFSHQAIGLSFSNNEVYPVYCLNVPKHLGADKALGNREVFLEAAYSEQNVVAVGHYFQSPGKWQAARWSLPDITVVSGYVSWQIACAFGHRGSGLIRWAHLL